MAGIKLYRSNSIEELSNALAENLKSPLSSPLAPEIILVQSLGMAKWLNLEIADRLRCWANSNFVFPNTFINRLFSAIIPNIEEKFFLDRELMTWILFDCLINIEKINPNIFSHLINYCKGEKSRDQIFRAFQLARQLAAIYDQYILYRPDFIYLWETQKIKDNEIINSEEKEANITGSNIYKNYDWQKMLWREISKRENFTHKAARKKDFIETLKRYKKIGQLPKRLPERVSIFGISSIPVFHLDILASISEFIEISFYVMTPAQGYFSDLKSAKEKLRSENIGESMGISPDLLHIETGNPLLASLGRAGADFMENLLNFDNLQDIDLNFIEPNGDTILSMVQQDIFLMKDRGQSKISKTILNIDEVEKDQTIVINSCHSPMREVEILNDYLLELFDSNHNITPADILVMTPNIEVYAPFVRAVFGTPEESRFKIPFSIADLSIKAASRSVDIFLQILTIPDSRFEVPFIMDILECDDVARCFNLLPNDIDLIREWIKQTAIRWGEDGKHREKMGLPSFEENSWRAGLDRLMAGYAMIGRNENFFLNILPCDCVEGNISRVLGSFSRFFNTLSKTAEKMAAKMTISEWSDFLMSVLDDFFLPNSDNLHIVQEIRDNLDQLKKMEDIVGFKTPIDSKIIKSWCDKTIGKEYHDSNFLNGGVTFCAMLPMRTIPAKVICIIGLNYGIFPRIDNFPNFDLIKQAPRRGDRSLRNEDRYLFLETIISARKRLYISYTGQGIEDNSIIPPSVVVSELMDYLDRSFVVQTTVCQTKEEQLNIKPLSSYIFTRHRLQPFSPAYFQENSGLFSYSKSNYSAASALIKKKELIQPFIPNSGSLVDSKKLSVDYDLILLNNLLTFFSSPQRYFLETTLKVSLREQGEILDDCEPFNLDFLETYNLKEEMLKKIIQHGIKQNSIVGVNQNIYKAKGVIPHGTAGEALYKENQNLVRAFYRQIYQYIESGKSKSLEIDFSSTMFKTSYNLSNSWRLKGTISDIWTDKIVRFRIASVKAKDILKAWITHIAFVSYQLYLTKNFDNRGLSVDINNGSNIPQTFLIGKDKVYQFKIPDDPISILDTLIRIYKRGLKEPIHFFPESSKAYAEAVFNEKNSPQSAIEKGFSNAGSEFRDGFNKIGEGESEEVKLCFKHLETPLDDDFCSLSTDIFIPILEHIML